MVCPLSLSSPSLKIIPYAVLLVFFGNNHLGWWWPSFLAGIPRKLLISGHFCGTGPYRKHLFCCFFQLASSASRIKRLFLCSFSCLAVWLASGTRCSPRDLLSAGLHGSLVLISLSTWRVQLLIFDSPRENAGRTRMLDYLGSILEIYVNRSSAQIILSANITSPPSPPIFHHALWGIFIYLSGLVILQ